ncbi:MAG: BMP family ABC transporter substrate-binding protein [Oscillospiraceae bacterium]|jgi:basic membrane protein A|nr:BMP family ABC transporter substrate-binding protein [Oscillospiraceae bacterium]
MKRRLLTLLLALALIVSVAACAKKDAPAPTPVPGGESTPTPDNPPSSEAPGTAAPGAPEGAALKIVIVTSGSSIDDGSFNQDNYNGILAFIRNNPASTVTDVKSADIADSMNDVESVLADYDVIVLPGFQFADVSALAVENPEKRFILIDSDPSELDGQTVFDNIYAMTFKEQESGFFAGIAAALETKSEKVAVVNGIAYPSNVNYQFGFEAGVAYANAKLGTSAEVIEIAARAGQDVTGANVGGNYVQDFGDEATGKVIGTELIALGADVIFVAAGASGNGVFTAAKENGNVKVIGCDVDQYSDGVFAGGNIILTSGLKVMSINVERALDNIAAGTFKGGNYLLGADTDSTGFVSAEGRNQLSENTIANLASAYELVKTGVIVPPGNFTAGITVEDFPGLK